METTAIPLVTPHKGNLRIRVAQDGAYIVELMAPDTSPPPLLDESTHALEDPPLRPPSKPGIVTVPAIVAAVAAYYGVSTRRLIGSERTRLLAQPRAVGMYLCRKITRASFPDIGHAFGGRHHTTVIAAVRRIEAALDGVGNTGAATLVDELQALRARLQVRG